MKKSILSFLYTSVILFISVDMAYADLPEDILKLQDDVLRLKNMLTKNQNLKIPSGTVVAFVGDKIPDGWILCDGKEVDRRIFGELFLSIGTAHGIGNGISTFNLPDYRGMFLRGVSNERSDAIEPSAPNRIAMNYGGNTGNKVGSIQLDAFKEHGHNLGNLKKPEKNLKLSDSPTNSSSRTKYFTTENSGDSSRQGEITLPDFSVNFSSKKVIPQIISGSSSTSGENETRPKNAYVNYIIKT